VYRHLALTSHKNEAQSEEEGGSGRTGIIQVESDGFMDIALACDSW
jgi:hypothetical protein